MIVEPSSYFTRTFSPVKSKCSSTLYAVLVGGEMSVTPPRTGFIRVNRRLVETVTSFSVYVISLWSLLVKLDEYVHRFVTSAVVPSL